MTHQSIALVSLVVRDYDEALAFFVGRLGFVLIEHTYIPEQDKRWVVVAPPDGGGAQLPVSLYRRSGTRCCPLQDGGRHLCP
jgi:catechol 2,3-dioxygenase-like lactoylglutathione lyase family enzyme